jgi:hypothetical protein
MSLSVYVDRHPSKEDPFGEVVDLRFNMTPSIQATFMRIANDLFYGTLSFVHDWGFYLETTEDMGRIRKGVYNINARLKEIVEPEHIKLGDSVCTIQDHPVHDNIYIVEICIPIGTEVLIELAKKGIQWDFLPKYR